LPLSDALNEIFRLNNTQNEMVIKLQLGSFRSSNLIHFQLEWRNSNWSGMKFE